jgi:ADP-ribose pyrophosphatase YjhB (NUDIX family)
VTLLLQPVRAPQGLGLLALRRGIRPQLGLLGLPGGFLEAHESWQEGMARELWEEAGLRVEAGQLRLVDLMSSTPVPNRLLVFGAAPEIGLSELPPFEASAECTERGLLFGPQGLPELMAFPLHTAAILRWFEQQNLDGAANWGLC